MFKKSPCSKTERSELPHKTQELETVVEKNVVQLELFTSLTKKFRVGTQKIPHNN